MMFGDLAFARKLGGFAGAVLLAAATLGACGSGDDSAESKSEGSGASTTTAMTEPSSTDEHDMEHDDGQVDHGAMGDPTNPGDVIASTADGTSPCEIAQPAPASPGQAGAGEGGQAGQDAGEHGHRGFVKPYDLTPDQRRQLIVEMRAARSVIDEFPTVADAEAAGYTKSTPFVPCIGAHYTNISRVAVFDPAAPSELLYDGTEPDSAIIGLSYLVVHAGGPPEGFAGENDLWHQHNANGGLCLKKGTVTVIGGEDISEADCEARGGEKAGELMANVWMVHAWVAPGFECSWGVFAGECPELGGTLGGTAWDPVA